MDFKTRTLRQLLERRGTISQKHVVAGLDGFVDKIVVPVDLRQGQGEQFTPIETITRFGNRILAAAGKSTNIALYSRLEKLRRNIPLLANTPTSAGTSPQSIA